MLVKLTTGDPKAREKPCLRCGYSLRQNLDAKHCPECGLSVWLSLNGDDSLERSNPDWVHGLSLAALALAAAQILGFLTYAAALVGGIMLAPWTHLLGWPAAAYALALGAGTFLLGANEHRHPDRAHSFRWGCRAVTVLSLLVALICLVIATSHYGPMVLPRGRRIPILLRLSAMSYAARHIDTAVEWLSLIGTLVVCAYLRKLALRLPRSRFSSLTGWLMLLPALAIAKSVPIVVFVFSSLLGWLLYLLPLIYLPATVALWTWFALQTRRAATEADRSWATETAGEPVPA